MVDAALARRNTRQTPLVVTSANSRVISMCAHHREIHELFLSADLIHAESISLVFASRALRTTPLPERVATGDLFHDVAQLA
jgi:N-acetylglucosaminyldiphosphoundecaprenol N-acetyl-beta-D-mannosaminyltransferase